MFRYLFVFIILIFSLLSVKLSALEITDLYQASIPVDSQARKIREQAIKLALKDVLLKVGGKKSVLTHDVLKKAQKKPSPYVSQYRYKKVDDQLSLVVSFNEDKVNKLFEQANLALWGSLRPQVLLWLVDEKGATRNIVSFDADSMIPSVVNEFSEQRGLPLIMPLMDLTDSEQVYVSDFWAYFPEQIQQASQRYFADTVIVMRVSDSSLLPDDNPLINNNRIESGRLAAINQQSGDIQTESPCIEECGTQASTTPLVLDWRVYTQGALYIQTYNGIDKINLITQALSDITELIYQSYALLTSVESDFVIEVKNVSSLTEDAKLFNFLSQLSAVKTVMLTKAQGNIRQFKLDLNGSKTSFLASLKLNNKLTQVLEPQFGDFSQGEQFTTKRGKRPTLVGGLHHGVKIIVLGEEAAELTVKDKVTGDVTEVTDDVDTLGEKSDAESVKKSVDNPFDKTVDTESEVLLQETAAKPPVIIPVFYWDGQ